jgi:diguanylate cyclase (GGDEF)-like protein
MRTAFGDPLQGDQLSGLMSRAAFFAEATVSCRQTGEAMSVILIDIDSFKAINEHYGCLAGDRAIVAIADVVRTLKQPAGRLGSDEFGVLLKGQPLAKAIKAAEDLHAALGDVTLDTGEWTINLSCSLGVAELHAGDSIDDLMKRADLALYRAKQEGRDRVATTPPESWMGDRPRLGVSIARHLPVPAPTLRDRRKGAPPGPGLYARIFAIIDLLIASGLREDTAAQIMAQRLTRAQVPSPEDVAPEEWWRDILDRRAAFRAGDATSETLQDYRNVVSAIESIPPHDRVECALSNDLWDRRRMVASERSQQHGLMLP